MDIRLPERVADWRAFGRSVIGITFRKPLSSFITLIPWPSIVSMTFASHGTGVSIHLDLCSCGSIDPMIGISFRLGPPVDFPGELSDGHAFSGIRQYQEIIAADSTRLLQNLVQQFAVYATGRSGRFSDRAAIQELVRRTQSQGGGTAWINPEKTYREA